MARNKKKNRYYVSPRDGGPAGASAGQRRRTYNPSAQATDSFMAGAPMNHGFSMQDEARNTTRDHLKWDKDEKLRYRPVIFVSAGSIDPLKEPSSNSASDKPTAPEIDKGNGDGRSSSATQGSRSSSSMTPSQAAPTTSTSAPREAFFVDTSGDKFLRLAIRTVPPAVTEDSNGVSGGDTDSSDEVILFKGRGQVRKSPEAIITVHAIDREIGTVEKTRLVRKGQPTPLVSMSSATATTTAASQTDFLTTCDPPNSTRPLCKDENGGDSDSSKVNRGDAEEALADYIKNADDLEELVAHHQRFARLDLGGSDQDVVIEDRGHPDADDDTTGTDGGDEGKPDDDSLSASPYGEDGWSPDVDDEQLARLLTKQEALGLGSDELLLFDEGVTALKWGSRRKQGQTGKRSPSGATTNNTTAVAQTLDDLDILMDWDRVNPARRKPKGKHGEVKFDVADAELHAVMAATYEKDRLKKKERKKEREELRAKGLLGKNANPDDLRIKYPAGINLTELEEEFRNFLMGSDVTLTLPPMDASARKIVHEVANRLKIKSKSAGSGDQRRPVLHRTKNTASCIEANLEQAMSRIRRRYFPRLDARDKQRGPFSGGGRGGGRGARSGYAALRCRDGEVVGASAPELDETNKGRAMLEKMGWSKGMALGAHDNKGILEPVTHVVKVSKAGLG